MWILIFFSLGIAIGDQGDSLNPFPMLSFASVLVLASWRWRRPELAWRLLFGGGMVLVGVAAVALSKSSRNDRHLLPPREANLLVSIERVFGQEDERIRGFGRVLEAEEHLTDLESSRVYFDLDTTSQEDPILQGDTIRAQGVLYPLSTIQGNAGFQDYLARHSVRLLYRRGSIAEHVSSQSPLAQLRHAATANLKHSLDPNAGYTRTYVAMLLGQKEELTAGQKDLFLANGAMHLFAISGLHIGVIATCGHALFCLLRVPRNWIIVPNLALVALFTTLTGGAPSAWRACLMVACFYLCSSTRRQNAPVNALALSATIWLLIEPQELFAPGFQMSYVTVASILLYGVPLTDRVSRLWQPFAYLPQRALARWQNWIAIAYRYLVGAFCVGIAAWMPSSILGLLYFGVLPTYAILANLILLPMASLVIVAGFASLLLGVLQISGAVVLFNHAAALLLLLMEKMLLAVLALDSSHVTLENRSPTILLGLAVALLATLALGYSKRWPIRLAWMGGLPATVAAAEYLIISAA